VACPVRTQPRSGWLIGCWLKDISAQNAVGRLRPTNQKRATPWFLATSLGVNKALAMAEGRTSSGDHQPARTSRSDLPDRGEPSSSFERWFFGFCNHIWLLGHDIRQATGFVEVDQFRRQRWLEEVAQELGFVEALEEYKKTSWRVVGFDRGRDPVSEEAIRHHGIFGLYLDETGSVRAKKGETPRSLYARAVELYDSPESVAQRLKVRKSWEEHHAANRGEPSSQGTAAPVAAPYFVGNPDRPPEYVEHPDGPPEYDPWRIPPSRKRSKKSGAPKPRRRRDHIPAGLRYEVLRRDQGKCQYCGRSAPEVVIHIDHKVPLSKGGATTLDNLQLLCRDDNLGKSDRPDWRTQP